MLTPGSLLQLPRRLASSSSSFSQKELRACYDVVVIGGGHNGLISAAYLAKNGLSVAVLEKRNIVGGAAVTEEIVPGFKFSRASYVLSLLRPYIIRDLKLESFGLKYHMREPYSSYTPIRESLYHKFPARSLLLSSCMERSVAAIGKFSHKDAAAYPLYEEEMSRFVKALTTLLDQAAPSVRKGASFREKLGLFRLLLQASSPLNLPSDIPKLHDLLTASAAKVLNNWFESEPLKATLATDALIGTYSGPSSPSTGYVLLHHIMGGVGGKAGAWAYPEGGMGGVTQAIKKSAEALGVEIFEGREVSRIAYDLGKKEAVGVILSDGGTVSARKAVLANPTPEVTFRKLTDEKTEGEVLFGEKFLTQVRNIDYSSPVTKINIALSSLPNFKADPVAVAKGEVGHHHKCTIHLNCESLSDLEESHSSSLRAKGPSSSPMIELVLPSSLDGTLAPKGAHVALLFTQFTPISPKWDKEAYFSKVVETVEEYAPGFRASIVGKEVLAPWDLEETFGLTGGNIFHGAMGLDQLYWLRPFGGWSFPETPVKGLILCGSGVHPGGGVMGLPGYLAAQAVLKRKHI